MKTVPIALYLAAACASSAFAQPAATATLRVTVVDPSNAIIVGATVTVTEASSFAIDRTATCLFSPLRTLTS